MKIADDRLNINWKQSGGWGCFLFILYPVILILPLVLTLLTQLTDTGDFLRNLSLSLGLVGFMILTMQIVLASHCKWLDYPFGLDIVMRFHKGMGIIATVMILLHPIFLAFVYGSGVLQSSSWKVVLGKIALGLLVINVLFAIFFKKLKVDYNVWRFEHKSMAIVYVLAFFHSFFIGPDLQEPVLRFFWIGTVGAGVGFFVYRNVVIPLWIRSKYTIVDVKQETHDTYTITFEPDNEKEIRRNPGQYMFVKFKRPGRPSELHPFTISASPLKTRVLQASIKQSGNFTNTIDQTKAGDKARIEAPFGVFSFVHDNPVKLIFIAGGIGITPIMSMTRYLKETESDIPVTIIHGVKRRRDMTFKSELNELPDNFRVVYVLSKPDDQWEGEKGHVTKELIEKYCKDSLQTADVYVCGPPVMMEKVIESLGQLGVKDKRIHFERFTI